MPDYGRDLQFGSFVTPLNRDPEAVVDLALLAERVGLDLVSYQDHPYQNGFLDTWTLMSWVAARTTSIRLATNVANLPLRPPAVLARAAASLDLLSGGRVELGLGAGGFRDAIAAMGGPDRTVGESVSALGEAIDVIRGIWDEGNRSPLRVKGRYYTVDGAKRGPAPAHELGIWLGAYKPRMLRLTGAKADGWIPTINYVNSPDMAESSRIIDEAAAENGRDPREIRRVLNIFGGVGRGTEPWQGPADDWIERMLPLILEHGFDTIILGSDNPSDIVAFAEEIAPAVREAVAAERAAAGTPTGRVRSAAALAKRAPGIDYEALPAPLAARAVEPGDRGYAALRSTYFTAGTPGLVLRPSNAEETAAALSYARAQGVPFAVRSGGHGISGRSTNNGGIVIHLGAMNGVEVIDRERRLVRVGAGARWGEVAQKLAPARLAISSGDFGDVGVGGLATAGGVGFLSRSYGLTIDHVRGAEVVLADGRVVRADAENHPDLFWALRGAGAGMGIVTSFDIEATELGDVIYGRFAHEVKDLGAFLQAWGRLTESSPRELTPFLVVAAQGGRRIAHTTVLWANDDTERATKALEAFLNLAPVLDQQAAITPYAAFMAPQNNPQDGHSGPNFRSALVDHLDERTTGVISGMFDKGETGYFQIRTVGGAVNDTPADATAYAHRTQNFALAVVPRGSAADLKSWDDIDFRGLYPSFESHAQDSALSKAFPPATLERLRRIKAAYDPENVFRGNFTILPATGV
ncbi:LLM class flavin-dependent oxidoreductase [Streptomyces sp. NPDC088732]|uniref:LLM class flavin-dependent oxidoreductase n=1 Tax=Streptomyces sp. NPDC088732 TaxID=3365879 RepID=UPI0038300E46